MCSCSSLSTWEKAKVAELEYRGIKVPHKNTKNPYVAAGLNVLPGIGNVYLAVHTDETQQWAEALFNLLLWPWSIVWAVPEGYLDAGSINKRYTIHYYFYGPGLSDPRLKGEPPPLPKEELKDEPPPTEKGQGQPPAGAALPVPEERQRPGGNYREQAPASAPAKGYEEEDREVQRQARKQTCVARCEAEADSCNSGCAGGAVADVALGLLFDGVSGGLEKAAKGGTQCVLTCASKKSACVGNCE